MAVHPSNAPDATKAQRAAWFDRKADRLEAQAAEARAAADALRTKGKRADTVASAGVAAAASDATSPTDPPTTES